MMMLQIKRWFAPPVFQNDEAKTRRAMLLNAALINVLAFVPVLLIGNVIGGRTPLPVLGANALAFAFCLVLRAWMRRGRVRLASMGLMTMGLVLITASAASLGTIRAPTTAMYLLMVITGGLLFDLSGMVITTALCSLLIGGLIGAENAGLLPRPDYSVTITQWIAYTVIFGWTGSLTFSALQALHQALARAQAEIAERARTEKALTESEQRLRGILANSPDTVYTIDLSSGKTIFLNRDEFCGFTRSELEAPGSILSAVHPDDLMLVKESWQQARNKGEASPVEYRLRRKEGEFEWIEQRVTVLARNPDGSPRQLLITLNLVTERKRAEQAQREAELRYRALFEQTHDAVFILDPQGRHLATNQRATDLLGYSFEEMQKLSVREISAELTESEAVLARLLRGEHVPLYERRFRKKNGDVVPVEIDVGLVRDASGNPLHVQSVVRDISERKRAEKALRESEQRLATIVETVPDGIVIVNREGRVSFANDFAQRTLGLTRSALARRTYDDPQWKITTTDGKPFPHEELPFARVMQTGKTVLGVEHAIQRPDGVRVMLSVNASPMRDDNHNLVGMLASITDITERTRAEEALRASEECFSAAFRLSPIPMAIYRPTDGHIVDINDAFINTFGYTRAETIEHTTYELQLFADPKDRDTIRRILQEHGSLENFEFDLRKKSGQIATVLNSAKLIDFGGEKHFLSLILDITERKRAEQERETLLQEIQHSREQLQVLSRQLIEAQENERRNIARELHDEVGQVMLAVKTNLETIQFAPEPATLNARLAESVGIVDRALEQLRVLALNLRPSLLDDFGLAPALEWFLERQARGAHFKIIFHSDLPEMRLPAIIETTGFRVVQAALANVARHAQAKRVDVTLCWMPAARELELRVRDDGIGFDVPAALARARHGASLGLLGMQERVRLAGGAIAIESTPGQGTEICARFPIKDEG